MAAPMCNVVCRSHLKPTCVYSLLCRTRIALLILQKRYIKQIKIPVEKNELSLELGSMAKFADGSCVAQVGETAVLATVVSNKSPSPSGSGMVPLTVDFAMKYSAAGRIPTNHLKRDLGTSDSEILISRCIDRSIRSLFPNDYNTELAINCNVLAMDRKNDPDVIGINAASAALAASDIPWAGPIGAVKVGLDADNATMNINPTRQKQKKNKLNLIISATADSKIVMIEGEAQNVPTIKFAKAIEYGGFYASKIAKAIQNKILNNDKKHFKPDGVNEQVLQDIEGMASQEIQKILNNTSYDKIKRDRCINNIRHETVMKYAGDGIPPDPMFYEAFEICVNREVRKQILDNKTRADGRTMTEMRPISAKVDLYKSLAGCALFQRGQTQVYCTVAFDSLQSSMRPDKMASLAGDLQEKNFMLHYEFPGYATNELKSGSRGVNRRELGHGALAEKGLRAVIPEDLPYSIRLTSEVMESNGSSSMASICGGSLALMAAGVNITEPAVGVAIGLITERDDKGNITRHQLLDDILGFEDYHGDMDFKVGGTKAGITCIQMDLKIPGIPYSIIEAALNRAQKQFNFIIDKMKTEAKIFQPRNNTENTPIIEPLTVLPAQRGDFIGVGGYNLKQWQAQTGVIVTPIDESTYELFAPNQEALDEFKRIMKKRMEAKKPPTLERSSTIEVKIVEIRDHGVMVLIHSAIKPVLLSNSQLDTRQVHHASALGFKVGDKIMVKYLGTDPLTGAIRISRKALTSVASKRMKYFEDVSTNPKS